VPRQTARRRRARMFGALHASQQVQACARAVPGGQGAVRPACSPHGTAPARQPPRLLPPPRRPPPSLCGEAAHVRSDAPALQHGRAWIAPSSSAPAAPCACAASSAATSARRTAGSPSTAASRRRASATGSAAACRAPRPPSSAPPGKRMPAPPRQRTLSGIPHYAATCCPCVRRQVCRHRPVTGTEPAPRRGRRRGQGRLG